MSELVQRFLNYISIRKAENTVQAYRTDLVQFLRYLGDTEIEVASTRQIDSFLINLGLSKASLKRKLSTLRTFYEYLRRQGIRNDNPAWEVEAFKIPKRRPDYLDRHEILALRSTCPLDMLPMLEFLLSSGVREAEICSLNIRDADLEDRTAKVIGKGSVERTVLFSNYCREILKNYLHFRVDKDEALFVNRKGRRLTPNTIYQRIRRLGDKVLRRRIYPHLLRHTFATYLLDGGATLAEVQQLLGHAHISTTSVYVHPTAAIKERYDKAIEKI